jgi:phosphatidylserine synthase
MAIPIAIGAALHVATFLALMATYRTYQAGGDHALFLGLPAPTAWMLYGVWWVPMYFILLYIFAFDRYVFSEADQLRFNEILERRDRRGGVEP